MKLIIVSNRLPVTFSASAGRLHVEKSVGGLATGLQSYVESFHQSAPDREIRWVGWPGINGGRGVGRKIRNYRNGIRLHPLFFSQQTKEEYYDGFSNKVIWPLFHYFPDRCIFKESYWQAYKRVNMQFSREIAKIAKPGDIVFVQDYHLMLVPRYLRKIRPDIAQTFFLHIPFPSIELFRILPTDWRNELLQGLLGADLVGFHTHEYVQHFHSSIHKLLGYEQHMGKFFVNGHTVSTNAFPLGINYTFFSEAQTNQEVKKEREKLNETIGNCRVILSVDRLDYTKGILNRLQGYEQFLQENPKWHQKVMLLLVLAPSRTTVESYQHMKRAIDEYVGRINGKFGNFSWTPIIYQYKSMPVEKLIALYDRSDVALITPLRDGMNLIAKEYVAAKSDELGVLILSETAGSAKELVEAIRINPNSKTEIADAIKEALTMPKKERKQRSKAMRSRLAKSTVGDWGNTIIHSLEIEITQRQHLSAKQLQETSSQSLVSDWSRSTHRLLLLDYDGTLTPYTKEPQMAKPSKRLRNVLKYLAQKDHTDIILLSGRDKTTLDQWFGDLPIGLIAEHGSVVKEHGDVWQSIASLPDGWKDNLLPIFHRFVDAVPGSLIEEKEYSIAWHYRAADPTIAAKHLQELNEELGQFTNSGDFQVLNGNKVAEIKPARLTKGSASLPWISKHQHDFILACGDDMTDEDMFSILPTSSYSIKVGLGPTAARFVVVSNRDIVNLLEKIGQTPDVVKRALPENTIDLLEEKTQTFFAPTPEGQILEQRF